MQVPHSLHSKQPCSASHLPPSRGLHAGISMAEERFESRVPVGRSALLRLMMQWGSLLTAGAGGGEAHHVNFPQHVKGRKVKFTVMSAELC